jgi:CubicO group peptidase (beta-lactamase class C family)
MGPHDEPVGALHEVFERWARREHAPQLAWGLIRDGELTASGGIAVADHLPAPTASTVFRIASMTKSFTGALVMALVAEGRLRLDDPVAMHVPELEHWRGPTTDGPSLTVRHLVSMESGLPTDDPWADRHLDIGARAMDDLMAAEPWFAWTPGIAFEYSNLGWGLVGRVVEAVTGEPPQPQISTRLLAPLGMSATTWVRPSDADVAEPHRWQDDDWLREPEPLGDGQIAPMGGLWSTVADLGRWVGWFLDAWPPRDDPDDGPVPRWARREQQQLRRIDELARIRPRPDGPSRAAAVGYAVGLGIQVDERLGTAVGHSGGLPGYGSHMRWLPDRGVGVVALANVTYANAQAACVEAIEVLADLDALGPARRFTAPAFDRAAAAAAALLTDWDDARAGSLFADNVALDGSFERRATHARDLIQRHGPLTPDDLEPGTPLRGTFTAANGRVRVDLGLDHAGRVQWLDVTDRSDPAADAVVARRRHLSEAAGTAYVVVRPVLDLADAFTRWQGESLDRLQAPAASVPAAHATLKTFGSSAAPLTPADVERIAEVVASWAAATPPLVLRAEAIDVFDEGELRIPVVRLETGLLRDAMRDLWTRCDDAGLPGGYGDAFGVDGWKAHCSLAYPERTDPARWADVAAWAANTPADVSCTVAAAELVAYDGGPERRAGRWTLAG